MPGGGGGALGDALPFEAGGGGVEDGAPHRRLDPPPTRWPAVVAEATATRPYEREKVGGVA